MLTGFKDAILKYPIVISPFHPSSSSQTIAALLASAFIGINILVVTDNKPDIDTAAGAKISDNMVKSYEIVKNLNYVPDILIIIDDISKFLRYDLDKKFKSKRNNLIFISSFNVQNDQYKIIFETFSDIKKININLLNSYPVIKVNKYNLKISEDLYQKYRLKDDDFWYSLSLYETDNLDNFQFKTSSKIRLLLTKIILNSNSKHLIYISPGIYCGVDNLDKIIKSINIKCCIINNNDNNSEYKNKNYKGVILTSDVDNNIDINNVNYIHFIGNVDYRVYSMFLDKIHQTKLYDEIIPEIEVNFYLTGFCEDNHVSPELHKYHFLERELKSSVEIFFPTDIQSDLCWKNGNNFVYCSSN